MMMTAMVEISIGKLSRPDSHLLTIKEAADFLRISRRSLFYLISNGRLQTVSTGRQDAWLTLTR